ncbi:MFS transporter [Cupriavidus metallidurans]|uniref:MFS transporter n=1 Tax=Cupriavidus metallidurans TaxID=119219 RepID=A0A482ITY3_9BURK|nr:MFS transporter [Cupriavidus metallidurans]QBP12515.1 MFS transporter [Cupriavidus metallidurans]
MDVTAGARLNGAQASEHEAKLPKKVVIAGFVSTFTEWYDFLVYGTVAALVFNQLFFPKLDYVVGVLAAFSTFAVGFIARPVGGAFFGHFGDRVGRKKMLIVTLLLMALSTFGIGLLPTYETAGIAAPILLVILRFLQGISLGGEWGGVVLLIVEQSPTRSRGGNGVWVQIGGYLGPLAGTCVLAVVSSLITTEQFVAWGWRIPFLISILPLAVGLYFRLAMDEPAVFKKTKKAAMPLVEVLREKLSAIAGISFMHGAQSALLFIAIVYVPGHMKNMAGFTTTSASVAVLFMLVAAVVSTVASGILSDYIGRRLTIGIGLVVGALVAYPLFWSLGAKDASSVYLAMFFAGVSCGFIYGPEPAFFSELFPTRYRFTGISLGAQMGAVLGGATAPILAALIVEWTGNVGSVPILIVVWQIVGLLGLLSLSETKGKSLDF